MTKAFKIKIGKLIENCVENRYQALLVVMVAVILKTGTGTVALANQHCRPSMVNYPYDGGKRNKLQLNNKS